MYDIYIEKAAERDLKKLPAADRRIDRLVYDLYDLTEAEVRIVEEKIAIKGEIRYNPHCGKE